MLQPPFFPPSYLSRVTASRCCVRVSSAGAVWSGCVVSSSTERLLTGWMRESNTVYFNLFRMPELCPEFLLSWVPQLAVSIPCSCSPGCTGRLNSSAEGSRSICLGSSLLIPCDSEMLMASLSAVIILLSLCEDI